jgi:ribosome biogenesis GTPase / thiamine phosphate phosphatase
MVRRAAGRRGDGQVVAANVDTFLIVTSANRDANPRRIERYLAAVWDSGARPVVVVNKVDLCPPSQVAALVEALTACAPNVPVLAVSAATGDGFDAMLAAAMATANPAEPAAQTLAFIGMSGVGKSSLVNRLLGVDRQLTLPINQEDRGRHATTRRDLFLLPGGPVVIDTPGMRLLGLVDDDGGLSASFAEIDELAERCRFADCRHRDEPGCAVVTAISAGELPAQRLAALHKLEREVRGAEARRDPAAGARAKQRSKAIHIAQRARYQRDPKHRT